eukprot:SAG31_NODE_1730_length_7424_cov_28.201911_5_plen_102_part_00
MLNRDRVSVCGAASSLRTFFFSFFDFFFACFFLRSSSSSDESLSLEFECESCVTWSGMDATFDTAAPAAGRDSATLVSVSIGAALSGASPPSDMTTCAVLQ